MRKVRRAKSEDAKGIHEAHIRSIREVCSKDHSADEIQAWSKGSFNEERRVYGIINDFVWVVENGDLIEGFGHFGIDKIENESIAHIYGLYLIPEASGQGIGKQIVRSMILEAKSAGVKKIILESSITAHEFYKKIGFEDIGTQKTISIGGTEIRCFPMSLIL